MTFTINFTSLIIISFQQRVTSAAARDDNVYPRKCREWSEFLTQSLLLQISIKIS